jgi:hypothetical protein
MNSEKAILLLSMLYYFDFAGGFSVQTDLRVFLKVFSKLFVSSSLPALQTAFHHDPVYLPGLLADMSSSPIHATSDLAQGSQPSSIRSKENIISFLT